MKHVLLMGVSALVLSGCATKGNQGEETSQSQGASLLKSEAVGVVSLMGNYFSRMYVGVTISGDENETLAIPDWRIDDEVESQTRLILERDYKLRTAPSPTSKETFWNVASARGPWQEPNWKIASEAVRAYCTTNKLNVVLIFAPIYANVPGRTQTFGGIGTYTNATILSQDAWLYFVGKVAAYDCKNGEVLERRVVSNRQDKDMRYVYRKLPIIELTDVSAVRTPVATWTSATKADLRTKLVALPNNAIAVTLNSIFAKP